MPDTQTALRERFTWFLLFRLGITTCLLGAVFLSFQQKGAATPSELMLPGVIGFTYLVSLTAGLLLTQVRNLPLLIYTQVIFDPLFSTGIIWLTGQVESPFAFLYHLAILNAAFLLFRRGALIAASLATLCYGVVLYSVAGLIPGLDLTARLVVMLLSFYSIALLGSYLTMRISQVETLLVERDLAFGHLSSLYQGIIQHLESGLLITNSKGVVEYANNAIAEILRAQPSTIPGKTVADCFPILRETTLQQGPLEFMFLGSEDTTERSLRLTHATLKDTYGKNIGTLYSIQDITSVKTLERCLKETQELEYLVSQKSGEHIETFAGLVGQSEVMNKLYQRITKVADSSSSVLIIGESGTGKELVAHAIHDKGSRANRSFIPVNCGAIPESLIESELFGHIKGAFTGAATNRLGLFREADGGTIFLDEIGELPLPLQVKLLRVLQEREVTPIGGNKGVHVDIRVIAATNRDLEAEVAAGRFRQDLYYRLNVISLSTPPLRERMGDLPLLIHHFLVRFAAANGKASLQISPQAMRILLDYHYPGNIRELENIIQHAVTMAEEETIRSKDFPSHIQTLGFPRPEETEPAKKLSDPSSQSIDFFTKGISLDDELETYEQNILRAALEKTGGVQKKAAEVLGINYRSLRHRLQKYHLQQ
jgi:transcriptional regulator with PAS, ATPase and Fis domain